MKKYKVFRIAGVVFVGLFLLLFLVSCSSVDPGVGVSYLEAVNVGDLEAADQFVCSSQQGKISEKVQRRGKTPPKGSDVLGLQSPGMSEIECEATSSTELTCTFWSPELQCTGNILAGETVSCTSWKLKGELKTIVFSFEDGKICDYD